mgnify:CR=1 FL=1
MNIDKNPLAGKEITLEQVFDTVRQMLKNNGFDFDLTEQQKVFLESNAKEAVYDKADVDAELAKHEQCLKDKQDACDSLVDDLREELKGTLNRYVQANTRALDYERLYKRDTKRAEKILNEHMLKTKELLKQKDAEIALLLGMGKGYKGFICKKHDNRYDEGDTCRFCISDLEQVSK